MVDFIDNDDWDMKQLNFLLLFVICLALVMFAIQNDQPTLIRVVKDIQVEAPLSVELMLAMGTGAVLAWVFSVWSQVQNALAMRKELRARDQRIQELEENLKRFEAELQQQPQALLSAADLGPTTDAELVTQ
ncbi:LapA family protein [Pantanalinema rosaneae CENA516]|uniref:LapA family protein n=1 Tax=Pantanalinema rosaneae TaxID=1620701 RepID=UPI003D6FCC96